MRSASLVSACGLVLAAMPAADALSKYAKLIPNGNGVAGVTAVGHTDPDSGGALNAFGKAFSGAGNAWTEALCKADSDGDGQTNGEELGDPCCVWKAGGTPAVPSGAKDPGSASSKLDDATLTKSRALCKAADAPAASSAAPAAAPGTVKPADGASNATPALTPGTTTAPGAAPTPAAGTTPAVTPATGAAGSGSSSDYMWVAEDDLKKKSSTTTSTTNSTKSSGGASSSTNSTNKTSAAAPATPASGVVLQYAAAVVVGALALAL